MSNDEIWLVLRLVLIDELRDNRMDKLFSIRVSGSFYTEFEFHYHRKLKHFPVSNISRVCKKWHTVVSVKVKKSETKSIFPGPLVKLLYGI